MLNIEENWGQNEKQQANMKGKMNKGDLVNEVAKVVSTKKQAQAAVGR